MSLIKKIILGTIGFFGCLYLTNQIFGPFLFQNLTASAPIGLYRRSFDSPKAGDYVICRFPSHLKGLIQGDNTLLIKKFIASQGAEYEVGFDALKINGQNYPIFPLKKIPPPKTGKFKVPKNQVMLMNDSPISFDSRYFGPVETKDVIGQIKLLIDYDKVINYLKRL